MAQLIKIEVHGFEMYRVYWPSGAKYGHWDHQDFWSEEGARAYIGRTWVDLEMDKLKCEILY